MLSFQNNASSIINRIFARIKDIQPGGETYERAMHAAAEAQLAFCVRRIHVDGLASDGGAIGQYSTTPMYVNPATSPTAFEPVGRTGRTTFISTGQPHRTRYFDTGYRGYREAIGLPADRVTLTLRGDLRDGLTLMRSPEGYTMGWTDETLHTRALMLEQKYGKPIWAPTTEERTAMTKAMQDRVREAMKR